MNVSVGDLVQFKGSNYRVTAIKATEIGTQITLLKGLDIHTVSESDVSRIEYGQGMSPLIRTWLFPTLRKLISKKSSHATLRNILFKALLKMTPQDDKKVIPGQRMLTGERCTGIFKYTKETRGSVAEMRCNEVVPINTNENDDIACLLLCLLLSLNTQGHSPNKTRRSPIHETDLKKMSIVLKTLFETYGFKDKYKPSLSIAPMDRSELLDFLSALFHPNPNEANQQQFASSLTRGGKYKRI
jgi:hypothetical protein